MAGELPKIEFKDYPVKVAVWEHKKTTDDGREYTEHSFTLSKTFKKKGGDGYEERSITLFPDDVLRAVELLRAAYHNACQRADVPKPKAAGQPRR